MIPCRDECLAILERYDVPDNIVRHSLMVERVALFLAERLSEIGNETDRPLLSAGTLLHDIAKIKGIVESRPHGELGAAAAEELGFGEVAPLIRQHVRLDDYADNGRIDETKLVNYADKRVNHEEIVTLDERFIYLFDHYGSISEAAMGRLVEMKLLTALVERQIFGPLAVDPTNLKRLLEEDSRGFYSR